MLLGDCAPFQTPKQKKKKIQTKMRAKGWKYLAQPGPFWFRKCKYARREKESGKKQKIVVTKYIR
jgi:hypothetical protein